MSSIARFVRSLVSLALAAGVVSADYGRYLDFTDPRVAGSGTTIERLGPNGSADVPGETVRYGDLPPRGREASDEALADLRNGPVRIGSSEVHPVGVGTLGGGVVVHEGTRYGVVQFRSSRGDSGVVSLLVGVVASAVGLAALVLTDLESWLRGWSDVCRPPASASGRRSFTSVPPESNDMNVLVVGGTGFIGSKLCGELAERGHDVTAMSSSPDASDVPAGVGTVAGDVTDYDSIESAFEGRDAVVNLVALSPLFRPDGGNRTHFEVHLQGTENVVRAAKDHGVPRIVQMSALGADADGETAYIQSKGQAEKVVESSGLEYAIFRPSVVFGEGGEFVPFTKKLAPRPAAPLPGGGDTKFQPIWVGDLVPMLADAVEGTSPSNRSSESSGDAVEDDAHDGHTYEVGGPQVLTLAEVAEMAHRADGHGFRVIPIPMVMADIGLGLLGAVGGPMGKDQARSLRVDNVTRDNDVEAFGLSEDDLTTLGEYLGIEERRSDSVAAR